MPTLSPAQSAIQHIAERLAAGNREDYAALVNQGEFCDFNHSNTADRCEGFADWVGFLPSESRAAWVSNGEPIWFDAPSLGDAVDQVTKGAELIN